MQGGKSMILFQLALTIEFGLRNSSGVRLLFYDIFILV